MINYLKSELYRLSRKKSAYYFYGILIVLFIALVFMGLGAGSSTTFIGASIELIPVIMIVVSTQAFISVYCDDLSSRTFSNTLSTGLPRFSLVVTKLLAMMIYMLAIIAILMLVFFGIYLVLGGQFSSVDGALIQDLLSRGVMVYVSNIAYASLASIVVFFVQSSALGIVAYTLLVMQLGYQILYLLSLVLKFLEVALDYSVTNTVTQGIMHYIEYQAIPLDFWWKMGLVIAAATGIAYTLFRRKEITIA